MSTLFGRFLIAFCFALAPGLFPGPAAARTPFADEAGLAALLPKQSRWALVVLDRESGRQRLAWGNALAEPLVPGSLTKLITSGAALEAVEKGETSQRALTGRQGKRRGKRRSGGSSLDRYLREMNVHSVNRMAERLFLRLGEAKFGPPATPEKGGRAITAYLAGFAPPANALAPADGSGLSRENRFRAGDLAAYLWQIGSRPWHGRLIASLPRPGLEGTVREVGYADRRFRVKSGRLDDAFSLAGYGVDREGRGVVFVFLVNFPGRAGDRRHSRRELLRFLARGEIPAPGEPHPSGD